VPTVTSITPKKNPFFAREIAIRASGTDAAIPPQTANFVCGNKARVGAPLRPRSH